MKRKRQQDWKRKQRSWFQRNFIGKSKSLARNSQRKYSYERYGTMQ